jgi:hypothetical protein
MRFCNTYVRWSTRYQGSVSEFHVAQLGVVRRLEQIQHDVQEVGTSNLLKLRSAGGTEEGERYKGSWIIS